MKAQNLGSTVCLIFMSAALAAQVAPQGDATQPKSSTQTKIPANDAGRSRVDEELRLVLLRVAFPAARITTSKDQPLDWSPLPSLPGNIRDALAGETEYTVIASPDKYEEGHAREVMGDGSGRSTTRRLRWRVLPFSNGKNSPVQYLGLAHYTFPDIRAANCCIYFARLFLLSRSATGWSEVHTGPSLIDRGRAVAGLRLLDLDGDGTPEVLFEGEGSQAGDDFIALQVYHIGPNGFEEWLGDRGVAISFNFYDGDQALYVRELDVSATKATGAEGFFFKEIWYRRKGIALSPPETGKVQFPRANASRQER